MSLLDDENTVMLGALVSILLRDEIDESSSSWLNDSSIISQYIPIIEELEECYFKHVKEKLI